MPVLVSQLHDVMLLSMHERSNSGRSPLVIGMASSLGFRLGSARGNYSRGLIGNVGCIFSAAFALLRMAPTL